MERDGGEKATTVTQDPEQANARFPTRLGLFRQPLECLLDRVYFTVQPQPWALNVHETEP